MRKEGLQADRPVALGEVTLIPISRTFTQAETQGRVVAFQGMKEPAAFVVVSEGRVNAWSVTGEELTLSELLERVRGLAAMLDGLEAPALPSARKRR